MRNIFERKRVKRQRISRPRCTPEGRPKRVTDESWSGWSIALENSVKSGKECSLVLPGPVTTASLIRMLEPKKICPYVVIRYMPGCFGAFPIEFLSDEAQQSKHEDSWCIIMSSPYENGNLTPTARQAVLDITEVAFKRLRGRFKMYAVFAEDDCVNFELDGSRVHETSAPSMTIDFGNVE